MSDKIVALVWDNHRDDSEICGKTCIVGKLISDDNTHIKIHGIELTLIDKNKVSQIHQYSCHKSNILSRPVEVSKDTIRELLIQELDKSLDLIFES